MKDLVRRHPAVAALTAYALLALLATWPLAVRFGTAIAGDRSGPWETLWSFWWWGESVAHHGSPFFSDALRWPAGLDLWPQVGNVPAALALLPLWPVTPHLPEVALYNLVLFASYPLAGLTTYLLCREIWGGHLAPFLAGALYTFAAHHLGAAAGPLEAVSLEWSPLYFLGLVRTLRRHGAGPPLLAGTALALAATTSPYQLAGCVVGTAVLVVTWWRTDPRSVQSPAFLRRVGLLVVTFFALAGWFYGGLLPSRRAIRAASGTSASADLLAFFVPVWSVRANGGSAAPVYAGYVTLALAVVAWMRAKAARPWLVVAIGGAVLAVGARLQVGGTAVTPALLPYAWIGWITPSAAAAQPARLAWLVPFGLATGACAALALVIRSHRRGAAIAVGVTALALVEAWPGAMPTSSWPAPRFLRDLARDGERWAVLDATAPDRQLWNQVLHRHPQLGGAAPYPGASSATGSVLVDRLVDRGPPVLLATEPARLATTRTGAASLEAIRVLQERNVRFVIADERTVGTARALRLPPAFTGDGIVVFEVPAPAG